MPNNIAVSGRGFGIDDLRPAIKFKTLVTAVFGHAGYNFNARGILNDSYFDDMYMLPVEKAGYMHDPALKTGNQFVASDTDITVGINQNSWQMQRYASVTGNTNGNFDLSTDAYTAPITETYKFTFSITLSARPASGRIQFAVYKNGVWNYEIIDTRQLTTHNAEWHMQLNKGDVITIRGLGKLAFEATAVSWSCTEAPYSRGGETISMSDIMPPVKLTDFLQAVCTTFNAVIYLDSSNQYHLVNKDDWYDDGSILDWTEFVDMTSVVHDKVRLPNKLSFEFAKSSDMASENFMQRNQREFGSMSFVPDVDFADAAFEVKSPFSIVTPQLMNKVNSRYETIGITNLQVQTLLNSNLEPACGNMVLFYMADNQVDSVSGDTYYAAGSSRSTYPYAGTFSKRIADTGFSLAYSLEQNVDGVINTDTLFNRYWARHIARIFAQSSRKVTMTAYIPVGTWLNLELNETIRIADHYYKIDNISYDINTGKTQIKMFTYVPVTIGTTTTNSDGEVTLPSNYVSPSSENVIFGTRSIADLNNIIAVGSTNYVQTGLPIKKVSSQQIVRDMGLQQVVNQVPIAVHMHKDETSVDVPSGSYLTLNSYDTIIADNTGYITGDTGDGLIAASSSGWVRVECSVAWDGHDKLKVALIKNDDVILADQEVETGGGSISLAMLTYVSDTDTLEIGLNYTGGGEDRTYDIEADLKVTQIV